MKSAACMTIVLSMFFVPNTFAQSTSREALIENIESVYFRVTVFSPSSPAVQSMLGSAMSANPGVSNKVWKGIAEDVAPKLAKAMTERGGPMDTSLRTSLATLPNVELQRLDVILNDPTYLKFQSAMNAPTTQRKVVQAIMTSGWQLSAVVDGVLEEHGLKVPH